MRSYLTRIAAAFLQVRKNEIGVKIRHEVTSIFLQRHRWILYWSVLIFLVGKNIATTFLLSIKKFLAISIINYRC